MFQPTVRTVKIRIDVLSGNCLSKGGEYMDSFGYGQHQYLTIHSLHMRGSFLSFEYDFISYWWILSLINCMDFRSEL